MKRRILSLLLCLLIVNTVFSVIGSTNVGGSSPWEIELIQEWQSSDLGEHIHEVAIDDIDGDYVPEIVVGSCVFATDAAYVYVFDAGTKVQKWKSPPIYGTPAADTCIKGLVTGDVDQDNEKEIILTESHGSILVFDGTTYTQEWRSKDYGSHMWGLAIEDVDQDVNTEILIGRHYAHVLVLDGLTHSEEWMSGDLGDYIMGIVVDDVDDDGTKEIITSDISGYIYIFDAVTHAQEWKSNDLGFAIGPSNNILSMDIDGDSNKEIITGSGEGHIFIFDGTTHDLEWKSEDFGEDIMGLSARDIDWDGTIEIIAGNKEGHFFAIDGITKGIEWQSPDLGNNIRTVNIENIDDDWNWEIIIGNEEGYVYVFEVQIPPLADAGPDQTMNEGAIVEFDGSNSKSENGYWNIFTVDSAGKAGHDISLALDSNNYPHISYREVTSGCYIKYAKWTGSYWSIETVDSVGISGYGTSIALDSGGNAHISYYNSNIGALKYAKWTDSAWTIDTVDIGNNAGFYSSIAIDGNDNPHISYYDSHNDNLKYAKWTSEDWAIETVPSVGSEGLWTSLALDSNSNPHISYYDNSNGDLKYSKWAGSSWMTDTIDSAGNVGQYTSLALDIDDRPSISYYDVSNSALKYANYNGDHWSITNVDTAGDVGKCTSLALDAGGYGHISYLDITYHTIKYAKWTGNIWIICTLDTAGPGYTSLQIDTFGNPHISYFDGINDDLKYAKWERYKIFSYEWDFDGDEAYDYQETPDNAPDGEFDGKTTYVYGDNNAYIVTLRITDEIGEIDTDTCEITVNNVAPTVYIDTVIQPFPEFILPMDVLEFHGSFIDPGIEDTHTIEWDFGDGNTTEETLTPSHAYAEPGIYLVTLTVIDDDLGEGSVSIEIEVKSPEGAVDDVLDIIEEMDLPEGNESAKSILEAVLDALENNHEEVAIQELKAFIRLIKGLERAGKLTEEEADDLIAAAQWIIDNLSG
ncbi:MAG: PKD domain-containing protein [Thermoplasmata archaeon]|nr:MAG: PKD domain-containing protein [Thermoplasmata archaeon]